MANVGVNQIIRIGQKVKKIEHGKEITGTVIGIDLKTHYFKVRWNVPSEEDSSYSANTYKPSAYGKVVLRS